MKYRVTVAFGYKKKEFDFDDIREANGFLKDVSLRIVNKEDDDLAFMSIVKEEEEVHDEQEP